MRRSHPSSLDPKGLAGISFDVCSIASTETATSTVAGRGRGATSGLRKRRGAGGALCADDDDCINAGSDKKGVNGLYSDPFCSMFSPTSALGGGMGGLVGGRRVRSNSGAGGPSMGVVGSCAMGPPDARRSHSALIGSKQTSHHRSSGSSGIQSVRVEISPTSPVSPIPPSATSNIAPTINAFRRCLLMNKGVTSGSSQTLVPPSYNNNTCHSHNQHNQRHGDTSHIGGHDTTTVCFYPADDERSAGAYRAGFVEVEVSETVTLEFSDDIVIEAHTEGHGDDSDVVEETHIFLFDNDDADDSYAMSASGSHSKHRDINAHCGGKERRAAASRRHQQGGPSHSVGAPYARAGELGSGFPVATSSRRQRRVCRSRYDIEESDEEDGCAVMDGTSRRKRSGKKSAAIYYVQVSHSALTPKDGPDDLRAVPQMPLLPSSVATAVVDEELAVLEELML